MMKTPIYTTNRITERIFSIGDRYHVYFERKVDERDKFVMTVSSGTDEPGIMMVLEFTRNQSLNIIDEIELVLGGGEHMFTVRGEFEETEIILHRNNSALEEEEYVGQHLGDNHENDPNQLILEISNGRGGVLLYFKDEPEVELFLSELKIVLE